MQDEALSEEEMLRMAIEESMKDELHDAAS